MIEDRQSIGRRQALKKEAVTFEYITDFGDRVEKGRVCNVARVECGECKTTFTICIWSKRRNYHACPGCDGAITTIG